MRLRTRETCQSVKERNNVGKSAQRADCRTGGEMKKRRKGDKHV